MSSEPPCACRADVIAELLAEAKVLLEQADKAARTRSLRDHEGLLRRQANGLAWAAGWLGRQVPPAPTPEEWTDLGDDEAAQARLAARERQ